MTLTPDDAQVFYDAMKRGAKEQPDAPLSYAMGDCRIVVSFAPPRDPRGRIEEGYIEGACYVWRINGELAGEDDVLLALQGERDEDRERRRVALGDEVLQRIAKNSVHVRGHVLSGRKAR